MINTLTVLNEYGDQITIYLKNPDLHSGFFIRDITGITPPKATISTTEMVSGDGSVFNSARSSSRNIVLKLGYYEYPTIEDTRLLSYKYFPTKGKVTLILETESRVAVATGYVESNDVDIFSEEEGSIVSIICPDSYLYSIADQSTSFSVADPLFEFPFSNESLTQPMIEFSTAGGNVDKAITYLGDAPVGLVMYIHATGDVGDLTIEDPVSGLTINLDSLKIAAVVGSPMKLGDDIVLSTVRGNKFAAFIRDGVVYNINNSIGKRPGWFQLKKGVNYFTYNASFGVDFVQIRVENRVAYEGV